MKAIICLPALNEAESIGLLIRELENAGLDFILSDGGSTDGTVEIARKSGVTILKRSAPGKGVGIREAISFAYENNYEVLVTMDCDNTYPVNSIPELLRAAESSDLVLACRDYSKISLPRRIANNLHNFSFHLLFGRKLSDINTGMRAIRVSAFHSILTAEGMDLEAEMCCKAENNKLKIAEINIDYQKERTGESKVKPSDFFLILRRIWREKWQH